MNTLGYEAHALSPAGFRLHTTGMHATREDAVRAAWDARPDAYEVSSGYGYGGGGDIRWTKERPGRFWHPNLPEVAEVDIERTGSFVRCRSWLRKVYGLIPVDVFTKRSLVTAALFSLLLPLAAHAEPSKAPCVVNVSTCTPVTCALLPGVGQVTGGLISNAHPKTEAELDAVKGIGPKKLETLRPFVVYGDAPTTCTSKQTAPKGAPVKDGAQ